MNLLMLTKYYPYGMGEAFIENEIRVLSKYFDRVIIIACEVDDKQEAHRELPPNAISFAVPAYGKYEKFADFIKGIRYMYSRDLELCNEYKDCRRLLRRVFLGYFEAKCQRIHCYIKKGGFLNALGKDPFVLYSYWFFMTARVGTLLSNEREPVYSFSRAHRYDLYEERNLTRYLPFRKLFLSSFDNVFPCSENGTEYLKGKYPEFGNKIVTAPLGTADYGVGTCKKEDIFRIVSCSRMEPVKRVSKIVDALEILQKEGIKLEWTHIGGGKEYKKVKKLAAKKLYQSMIDFKGNIPNREVLKLYKEKSFDLFVNVSSSEGLPVSIMEAISFGIPVVATDVGGTSEIVVEEVSGTLLAESPTPGQVAHAIRKFVDLKQRDGGEYRIYRNNCRKLWEERFTAKHNYTKLYDMVERNYNGAFNNRSGI